MGVAGAASTKERSGETGQSRWEGRPWLARAVRAVVVVVPFALSIVSAYLLAQLVPPGSNTLLVLVRFLAIAVAATVVMRATDRLMRRLMPLAALLDLTLIFPDQAPSRYRMALRNGASNIELQERIDRYIRTGRGDTAAAAEHLLDLVAALSRHDRITRGHSERVRAYAQMIGEEMGLSPHDIDRLRWAALIHDVGKLRIPTEILNKPSKLTDEEYEVIKQHPEFGAELALPLADWLGEWVLAVVQHHEKWDGTGYPFGLKRTEISQAGRIVAVADVFDVLTSVRSYKHARTPTEARAELARCAGTHFDPAVVRAFMSLSLGRLRRVMGPLSWLAQLSLFPQSLFNSASAPAVASSGTAGTAGVSGVASVASAVSGVATMAGVAGTAVVGVVAAGVGASWLSDSPAPPAPAAVVETVEAPEPVEAEVVTDVGVAAPDQLDAAPQPQASPETTEPEPEPEPEPAPEPAPEPVRTTSPAEAIDMAGATPPISVITTTAPTWVPVPEPILVPSVTVPFPVAPPVPTAATTTTVPETTTTTTVPETTTTTAPPTTVTEGRFLLASPASGDQVSREVLPLLPWRQARNTRLPNYDTDRDTFTGLTIQRGGAFTPGDPARMQRFALDTSGQVTYRGRAQVDLNVGKSSRTAGAHVEVIVALAVCADASPDCTVVSKASRAFWFTGRVILIDQYLDLGAIDVTVAPEQRLELWVAAGAGSWEDLVLAYDATGLRSQLILS